MKIFLLFLSVMFYGFSHANSNDSVINVKGYYIIRYVFSEIENSYKQKVNRLDGKSYSTAIDFENISFFIPFEIKKKIIQNDYVIEKIKKANTLNLDSVFFMPTSKYKEDFIRIIFNKHISLSKAICLFQDLSRSYPYYKIDSEKKYIYKCIYIEAEALTKTLENTEINRAQIGINSSMINKDSFYFTVFFLTKIKRYSPFVKLPGLEEWFPYLDDIS